MRDTRDGGSVCAPRSERGSSRCRTVLHHEVSRAMRLHTLIVSSLLSLACANACKSSTAADGPPMGGGGGQPPPAEVGIVTLKTEAVTLQTELAGRTTASLSSDLRPQVTGILKARTFEEGARVKAGQVMYQIDP